LVHPSMAEPDCCVLPTVLMAGAGVGKVEDEIETDRSIAQGRRVHLALGLYVLGQVHVACNRLVTSHGVAPVTT